METIKIGSTILPESKTYHINTLVSSDSIKSLLKKADFKGLQSFLNELREQYNTTAWFVGGCVRDLFLGKESKDVDFIVPHIDIDELSYLLSVYGTVDLVGKSFGILKFKPFKSSITFDVAVPRVEKSTGDKHTDFEVVTRPNVTLTEDLQRRDFTMNALVMTFDGLVFDPFGGIKDIENKTINLVSKDSFTEDPLRMLRCLQFSSRFGFNITEETTLSIYKSAHLIKNISGERVLIEIEKGLKGNVAEFACDLHQFGLMKELFPKSSFKGKFIFQAKTVAEFLFSCSINVNDAIKVLKISTSQQKELKGLYKLYNTFSVGCHSRCEELCMVFDIINKNPNLINTMVFDKIDTHNSFSDFKKGIYPKSYKELEIDGYDIMSFGFKSENIGLAFKAIVSGILCGKLKNKRNHLLEFLKETSSNFDLKID